MAVNKSARKSRITVGGLDFSNGLIEASDWQTSPLAQSGLITTTCTIKLARVRSLPGSLDDRDNNLWRVGQTIYIDVADTAGVLKRHPTGTLRILNSEYDVASSVLTVRCGCLISLLNFKQPVKADEAEIDYENFTPRSTIITKLLTLAGVNSKVIPPLPYPINYPIRISGSYLETVGKLLYSAGYVGWIDKSETFRVKPISFTGSSSLTLQIGGDAGDELWYERLTSAEAPREIIKVNGVRPTAQIPEYPKNDKIIRYGTASQVDPELGNTTIIISLELTEEEYNDSTKTLTKTTNTYTPLGLALPNRKHIFPTSRIHSEKRVETRKYETSKEGKLLYFEIEIDKLAGSVLQEYIAYQESSNSSSQYATPNSLITAERILSYYFYDSKNRPTEIETFKYETIAALLSNNSHNWEMETTPPTGRQLSEITTETWKHKGGREWEHKIYAKKTLGRIASEAIEAAFENSTLPAATIDERKRQRKLALAHDSQASLTEVSNSGQTVPPAPERHPPKVNYDEKQVCGEAHFAQHGGNPYKERDRTFSAEYLEGKVQKASDDELDYTQTPVEPTCIDIQCKAIAELEGKLLFGRFKGQDIGLPLFDSLLDWEPLMQVQCVELGGARRVFALDDSHWMLKQEEALCDFGCIWLGNSSGVVSSTPITISVSTQSGATQISIHPLTASIPAGATINLGGITVLLTQVATTGAMVLHIAPLQSAIASGATTSYTEELMHLPYVPVQSLAVTGRMRLAVETLPYAPLAWKTLTRSEWQNISELQWRNVA